MAQGNLFVISGPSGAGKGTLVARLMQVVPNCWFSVSATTRRPREGEVDGVHYFFVSEEEFDTLIAEDGFLEWAQYTTSRYGTPKKNILEHIAQGQQVILDIEIQGAAQVKQRMPEAHMVFIEPPSLEVLEQRLRCRGTDDEESIQRRLATARMELSHKMEYDIRLVNDNLQTATEQLVAFVQSFT